MFKRLKMLGEKALALVGVVAPVAVVSVVVSSVSYALPIFDVDTATLTQVTADVVAWGLAIMGVALTVFAYRWVRKMIGR